MNNSCKNIINYLIIKILNIFILKTWKNQKSMFNKIKHFHHNQVKINKLKLWLSFYKVVNKIIKNKFII